MHSVSSPSSRAALRARLRSMLRWSPALLLAASGMAAADEPEVHWYTFNLPPLYIVDTAQQGAGILDLALHRHLLPALPGYQHRITEVPLQRLEAMLRIEPNACALGLFRNPEREKNMIFSVPFLLQAPPGVFVQRESAEKVKPYVDANGRLGLGRLLAEGKLSVGIGNGRSYGALLDALLAQYRSSDKLFVNKTINPTKSLLQMGAVGRLDVIPGFPYEATYHGIGQDQLKFFPVIEQTELVAGHAACARTEFGAQMIAKIDAVLLQRSVRHAIALYYESWLDEETRALVQRRRSPPAPGERLLPNGGRRFGGPPPGSYFPSPPPPPPPRN